MRAPACLILTLSVVAPSPQPTPPPPLSSPSPSLARSTQASPFTNCIESDMSEIEELRTRLNNTIEIDLNSEKENVSFGLLEEDWNRLKLLEQRLPNDSLLKPKLVTLFRLLISALFQAHKPSIKEQESKNKKQSLNHSELNWLFTSEYSSNPTVATTTTLEDQIDNIVAESEQRESVLPFSILYSTLTYTTIATSNNKDTNLTSKYDKAINIDRDFLQAPEELPAQDHSGEIRDTISDPTTKTFQKESNTPNYDSIITEDYQGLKINPGNEHRPYSGETDSDTNEKEEEQQIIKFVEEYEGIKGGFSTDTNPISIIDVESGTTTVNDSESPGGITYTEVTASSNDLETGRSELSEITTVYETTATTEEASEHGDRFLQNTTMHPISSDTTLKSNKPSYGKSLNMESTSDPNTYLTTVSFTPDNNDNTIEDSEKEQTNTNYETESSSPNTVNINQSTEHRWSQDFSTIHPSSSRNGITEHQSTESLSSDRPYKASDQDYVMAPNNTVGSSEIYSTAAFPNPENTIGTTNIVETSSSVLSDDKSRQDKALYSSTFSSTQGTPTTLSNNETFHSFATIFPDYPKITSPTLGVKKLIIYPQGTNQKGIFPPKGHKIPPNSRLLCRNKNNCARVENVKFNTPQDSAKYMESNSVFPSGGSRFYYAKEESNSKNVDDHFLWDHKIRTLRNKAVKT